MKRITKELIKIYKPLDICWLGYKLTPSNATYHHILKKEYGGKEIISNGALLAENAHKYLHIIEYKEIEIYHALNEMLKIINKQGHAPTQEQYRIINCLFLMFEEKHIKDKTSKNKILIKHQYLEREIRHLK